MTIIYYNNFMQYPLYYNSDITMTNSSTTFYATITVLHTLIILINYLFLSEGYQYKYDHADSNDTAENK